MRQAPDSDVVNIQPGTTDRLHFHKRYEAQKRNVKFGGACGCLAVRQMATLGRRAPNEMIA